MLGVFVMKMRVANKPMYPTTLQSLTTAAHKIVVPCF